MPKFRYVMFNKIVTSVEFLCCKSMWRPDQVGESIKAQNSVSHGRKETMTKEKYKNKLSQCLEGTSNNF